MCDKTHYDTLEDRVDGLEDRLCKVETAVGEMRGEVQTGFTQLNHAVANLANEFGTRMNILDQSVVTCRSRELTEREKWGATLRNIACWVAYSLITAALLAAGVNVASRFFGAVCK